MRLGLQTNSLTNHVLSRAVIGQPEPVVGMGATILSWTDRSPATIIGVFRETKILHVREDSYRRMDSNGMSESQTYEYFPNPRGYVYIFRQNKQGVWEEVDYNPVTKRHKKNGGHGLRIGERSKYHDFSF